jgi:cystathionine beta-lyase
MSYNFDEIIDRRNSDSEKWNRFGADVLPMWVADMDFRVAEPILRALQERVAHGVFGYGGVGGRLRNVICERLFDLYQWQVKPEEVLLFPGVVTGFNMAIQALAGAGEGVLIQPPVYMPFLTAHSCVNAVSQQALLVQAKDGSYPFSQESFSAAMDENTRVFLLCNPHNPIGRVWTRDELTRMGELCLSRNVLICSDDIHSDLIFSNALHLPIASIDPEIAQRTITIMAPSKTYNLPGLYSSFGVIQNPDLRRKFQASRRGLVGEGNLLGFVAAEAAYRDGSEWLSEALVYLEENRNYLFDYVQRELPMLRLNRPQGTYLAWLDCRNAGIEGKPGDFFLKQARVGLMDGSAFGAGGDGFVRLNFACPRSLLTEGLERMKWALQQG